MTRILSRPRAARRARVRTSRPRVEALEDRCLLANFLVTTIADSSAGSLRQAILDANAAAGVDEIDFDIPGPGVHTITPASALPVITDPVIIDGTTQPGFDPSTHRPVIELAGSIIGTNADGLDILAGNSTVRGLVINRFGCGIRLRGNGGDRVEGNYIGIDATGTVALANGFGIYVQNSDGDTIGGTEAGAGNLLSGNTGLGLGVYYSTGGVVQGNLIGTDATGTLALGNGDNGISVASSSNILIGGTMAGARNIVSGNAGDGMMIWVTTSSSTATGNVVQGNYIGLDATGTQALGNQAGGVLLSGAGVTDNTIGGTATGAGNVIAGNRGYGVNIPSVSGTDRNMIQGNLIGTDATGTLALGNSGDGVGIGSGATDNTVGGTAAGARNIISGNVSDGVGVSGERTVVQGNFIGTDITGTMPLGNTGDGILMNAGVGNLFISGNVISDNGDGGIRINTGSGDRIEGNFIGTDATGTTALGNHGIGLRFEGPPVWVMPIKPALGNHGAGLESEGLGFAGETIGGTAAGAGNVISGNTSDGLFIGWPGTLVQGNFLGTDVNGTAPLPNGGDGVRISGSSMTIGGLDAGTGNTIAFNAGAGVVVSQGTGNSILSNAIFSNGGLGIDLGGYDGDGVISNDPGDADQGANNLQNFPVLTSVTGAGNSTTITATLDSTASTSFTVQFFSSDSPDPSGFGEGQRFLGATTVTTDGTGHTAINATVPDAVGPTQFVTMTATDPAGNTSEFSQSQADLAVSINAPATAPEGQGMTYTLTVTNAGPSAAPGVTLVDTLPADVAFVSATGGVTPTDNTLTFGLGTLPVGTTTITIVVQPQSNAAGTAIIDKATVSGTLNDPDTNNNMAAASTSITAPPSPAADLAVAQTASPSTATVGQDVTYTIVVTDNGPDPFPSATLTDTLPSNITFVSASGQATPTNGVLTLPVGPLAAGATATFTVVVRPDASGTLTNVVNVAATLPDPKSANNRSSLDTAVNPVPVPPSADLAVTQSASPGTATAGQDDVTFTIEVTNHGPDPISDATLIEALPAGAAFVSATGGVTPSQGTLTFPIGGLESGARLTFTIVVRAESAGTLTAKATVSAATADPSMADNTAVASANAANGPNGGPTGPTGSPSPSLTTTPAAKSDGPRIIQVRRHGIHLMPTTVVLTFDEALDTVAAQDVRNYRITDRSGSRIAIRSAVYDAARRTVTLQPSERISIHHPYTLMIRGTKHGVLSDGLSRLLDGQGTGRPGSDYRTRLTWRNLILPSWYHPSKGSVAKRR